MRTLKYALVTGASSGLGREFVRQLVVERGMTVLATARRRDRLQELASELPPGTVEIVDGDLTDPAFRSILWGRATAFPGGLDLLVNNAGCGNYASFIDQDASAIRQMVELNLIALMDLSQMAASHMKARGGGQILQVSSVLGFVGIPYSAAYVMTKHGVNGLVKCLRYELRGTDVRVWAACPGRTRSEFSRTALGPGTGDETGLPDGEPTDRVVRSILRGLDRDVVFLVPTWIASAGLALARWCPPLFDRLVVSWAERHVGEALRRKRGQADGPS